MAFNPGEWESLGVTSNDVYQLLQAQQGSLALPTRQEPTFDPKRFPAAPIDNLTPPASDESSPEPESIQERNMVSAGTANKSASRRSTGATVGGGQDDTKRKVDEISDSDDSEYGQPTHKSQHRNDNSSGRKSLTGSTGPKKEENRALKRKEQNRAAQRAFRERKERHVKELEDRVAELEEQQRSQSMEADNLRDLLGRLQSENLMLKQSAFTFSFPGNGTGSTSSSPAAQTQNASSGNRSSPKLDSPSSSSASDSPETMATPGAQSSLFAPQSSGANRQASSSSLALTDGTSSGSDGSSPRSLVDVASTPFSSALAGSLGAPGRVNSPFPRFQSSPGAFGLGGHTGSTPQPIDFSGINFDMFGSGSEAGGITGNNGADGMNGLDDGKNGITTIASNPMFTSFGGEGMGLDPMAWASFGPADYGLSSNTDSSASAFGNNGGSNANGFGSFEDLFNNTVGASPQVQQPQPTSAQQPTYLDFTTFTANMSPPSSVSGKSSGSQIGGGDNSQLNLVSDEADLNSLLNGTSGKVDHGDGSGCPKTVEDVKRIQAENPVPSIFGPPLPKSPSPVNEIVPAMFRKASPGAPSPSSTAVSTGGESKESACAHARMAALCADLPRTTKKPGQIEIGRAWEKIRQHREFTDCDIDQLCSELSAKARCDGSRPVLEESSFNDIVQNLSSLHKQ